MHEGLTGNTDATGNRIMPPSNSWKEIILLWKKLSYFRLYHDFSSTLLYIYIFLCMAGWKLFVMFYCMAYICTSLIEHRKSRILHCLTLCWFMLGTIYFQVSFFFSISNPSLIRHKDQTLYRSAANNFENLWKQILIELKIGVHSFGKGNLSCYTILKLEKLGVLLRQ